MRETGGIVILITAGSKDEARRIAELLVTQRKAACVNIIPGVASLFWWESKLDSAWESLMMVKTRASLLPEILSLVKEIHSYDVPEVIALPVIGGNEDYLRWLNSEVTG